MTGGVGLRTPSPWPPRRHSSGGASSGSSRNRADRTLRLDFGDGRGLAIELAPHHPNLVLLEVEADRRHIGSARAASVQERLTPGRTWRARGFPAARYDPFHCRRRRPSTRCAPPVARAARPRRRPHRRATDRRRVDRRRAARRRAARDRQSAGRPSFEAASTPILQGAAEILIEAPEDPSRAPDRGESAAASLRLLPWRPDTTRAGRSLFALRASGSDGVALPRSGRRGGSYSNRGSRTLGGILRAQLDRTENGERKVRESLRSFDDPDRHRRMGEALLAGLHVARRSGTWSSSPIPYDADGPRDRDSGAAAEVPRAGRRRSLPASTPLPSGARTRRALARRRWRSGASRLEALPSSVHGLTVDEAGAATLEAAMRAEGLPVGLVGRPGLRARGAARRPAARRRAHDHERGRMDDPRRPLGPGQRQADVQDRRARRHLASCRGRSRRPRRHPQSRSGGPSVPPSTLAEAAGLALWFSDARSEADRRRPLDAPQKRAARQGGRPGRVVLKRFETVPRARRTPAEAIDGRVPRARMRRFRAEDGRFASEDAALIRLTWGRRCPRLARP